MKAIINLYSQTPNEIKRFLESFYSQNINLTDDLFWEKYYDNPIDIIDLVSCFIDNKDNFKINIWVSIDNGVFINVTDKNIDEIIRYIYERFP